MASPGNNHSQGFARLLAVLERTLGQVPPITTYGCLPFTRAREMGPNDKVCPVCRRPRHNREPTPPDLSDALICGGCHRGSHRVEYVTAEGRRRAEQRKHLIAHNRMLTADTPRPAILDEEVGEPVAPGEPPPSQPRTKRTQRSKEAAPC